MLDTLPHLPKIGQKVRSSFFSDSHDSAQLATLATQTKPIALFTADTQTALRLKEEIPFFAPHIKLALFPDWETLPYDRFSPHSELISERLATLWQIYQGEVDLVIVPISTALLRLAPLQFLLARTFLLKTHQRLNSEKLKQALVAAGYLSMSQVVAPGEFAVRGGLIDIFPMGSPLPYRIELFDDEIESLRTFDPDTQRTLYPVAEIRLLPAREYPTDQAAVTLFRQRYRECFEGDPSKSRIYREVSSQVFPAGIEYYLPLFFENTATLFDYLPDDTLIIQHRDLHHAAENFWVDINSRYDLGRGDAERPLLPPSELYLRPNEFFEALKPYARLVFPAPTQEEIAQHASLPHLAVDRRAECPLSRLQQFIQHYSGRILLTAESLGRRETMFQFLHEYGITPCLVEDWQTFATGNIKLALAVAPLYKGFLDTGLGIAIVTEAELYHHVARSHTKRQRVKNSTDAMLRDLAEIKPGDPVVHEQHGIGRYMGLVSLDLGEGETEFMELEYADSGKLYVPVSQLSVISRYAGASADQVTLYRLGSPQWEKAKKKAAEKARDTAAELLNLYAQRTAREGHAFSLSAHDYASFAAGFGFEETPDQAATIEAVIADMTCGKPMDRLVCGDVGFGKTEVALRAAFVAVLGGKQVAVLVPTTLLAEQHYQNFCDRFADWPVKIAELSRFRSTKEIRSALNALAEGTLDIVIGTHKLIQADVMFKRLGLVIIDEEHRFGVRQKEQLKQLRANVDVLTLTATPIPRTLSMAMEGLRDFSVIATAPARRLAVKTFVMPFSEGVIREAVLRELKRGGQVFFLHNEVETIETMRDRLVKLLPEARIGVAHGQLRERELEQVMRDFLQQRFNVLLCSTIIETGIDIPNANTILIHRADKFGLAQLHQLRGRVGRSHHQAYAYLLTPDTMTKEAVKRLEAIQLSEELGSGFYLAMHDLEIRGAGEILGEGQSGEMQDVGFTLFVEMLKQAVNALKQGKEPDVNAPLGITTEINLHSPALLPESYCPDIHERLVLYKRLASCDSESDINSIQEELVDRFGLPPEPVKTLINSHRIRLIARELGVQKVDASETAIQLNFVSQPQIEPMKVIQLIQQHRHYKLIGQDKLRVEVAIPEVGLRIVRVKELLKSLTT